MFLFDSFLPIILGNFIVLSICKKFYVNQYYPKLIIPLTDNSACDRMGTQGTVANHKWWYREIATFPYSPDWGIVIASYSNHCQCAGGQGPVSSQWSVLRGGFSWSRPRPGPTSGLDLGSAVIVGAEADWDQLSMTASGRQLQLVPTQRQLAICCTAVSKYKDVCRVVSRMTATLPRTHADWNIRKVNSSLCSYTRLATHSTVWHMCFNVLLWYDKIYGMGSTTLQTSKAK